MDKVVAQLNIDMIGRNRPDAIRFKVPGFQVQGFGLTLHLTDSG